MKKFLFTTLMSNDLGLLTRSLPIARELRDRGHQVVFCNPAKAPRRLISEAGFENLPPKSPLNYIMSGDTTLSFFKRLLRSNDLLRNLGVFVSVMSRFPRLSTAEIWNMDHFLCVLGMWNENYVRADVNAHMELIGEYNPNAVVDFWNEGACIAARACHKPLITVIQADQHPGNRGFIWWKESPPGLPTQLPAINRILGELHLKPINKTEELFVGDMTLLLGIPETDPIPETSNATYMGRSCGKDRTKSCLIGSPI